MHSLSSLQFLPADSTARPKSNTPDGRKLENENAFKNFPDYSKMNKDRHSASRTDTFTNTGSIASRKKNITSNKISGEDMTSINSSYLISGLRHDVRELGKEIKADVQDEIQQLLESLHLQVTSTLDVVQNTRDSSLFVIMEKMKTDIHKVLSDAGWPLKVDFSGIREDYREGEQTRTQSYKDMMSHLEERIEQKIAPIAPQIVVLQDLQEQVKVEFEQSHKRMLDDMMTLRQAIITDIAPSLQKLHRAQQSHIDGFPKFEARLEAQVVRHVSERPVNVDFEGVLNALKDNNDTAAVEFESVRAQLGTLTSDMTNVRLETAKFDEIKVNAPKELVDQDSNWTQTDIVETAHGFAQTDDKFWKSKVTRRPSKQAHKALATKSMTKSGTDNQETQKTPKKGNTVFADASQMKAKARQALIRQPYDVFDFYHATGLAQNIARSQNFENVTFAFVVFNAIWIAVDADYNKADLLIDAHPVFQIAENVFCSYFAAELLTRFLAFKRKLNCFKDGWFVFDLALVSLMVLETWVLSIVVLAMGLESTAGLFDASMLRLVRMVKILRLSRLARLMRAVPEIIILLKGVGAAARSVASLFALWLIIIYVFAVFFVQTLSGDAKENQFETVPISMNTLLLQGILPDNSGLVEIIATSNPIFWPVIVGFVLFASVTLSYMLIGVLVQIVHVIAEAEREKGVVESVANHLRFSWQARGYDMDSIIERDAFQSILVDPSVAMFLTEMGVDIIALADMSEMLFEDMAKELGGVNFETFVNVMLNMRGSNPGTVQDGNQQLRFIKRVIKESVKSLDVNMNDKFVKCGLQITKVKKAVMGEVEESSSEEDVPPDAEVEGGFPSEETDSKAFGWKHSESCDSLGSDQES